MLTLTQYEQEMLVGKYGRLKQQALQKVIEYARVLGAQELCEVTMAHVFCGAHGYLSAAGEGSVEKIVSQMQYCTEEILPLTEMACYCQSDCGPMDPKAYARMGVSETEARRNREFLDYYCQSGINMVGTCVPYLCGFIPMPGEHYVSSESHAVTLMNSLWGACGNADGLEAGFWAAACGRMPKWGNHLRDNRQGTHIFDVECAVNSSRDWDLLGYTIGRKLPPHAIPVINGITNRLSIISIKYFFAAMATTAGPEMCHIVGVTPEAPTLAAALGGREPVRRMTVTAQDLEESYRILGGGQALGPIDYISLGCPHYSIEELRWIAKMLDGKKVAQGTTVHVWTASPIKEVADRSGYTGTIEAAGAVVLTSSCPLTSERMPTGTKTVGFDSAKQAHYIAASRQVNVGYGSLEQCIAAAVTGRWDT